MTDDQASSRVIREHRWIAGFGHHLLVALVVASVVAVLHWRGALGWLDAVMLSAAASVQAKASWSPEGSGRHDEMPVVVMIGEALYEREFRQTSPLDREKLAQFLRTTLQRGERPPATLVIDLDLSPVPGDERAQSKLDQALGDLVRAGTHLLIPLPGRVETSELQHLKFSWLQKVCSWNRPDKTAGVTLALPQVREHFGRVVQYDTRQLGLGVVAAKPARADHLCERVRTDPEQWRKPFVSTFFDARVFQDGQGSLQPFNAHFFRRLDDNLVVADSLGVAADTGGRTVFLGGAYDDKDRFLTPLDPAGSKIEGVAVHAATWFSVMHPVDVKHGIETFLLDVLLGLLIGYLFGWTWGWYRMAQTTGPGSSPTRHYLTTRGLLLLNLAVFALLIVLFMSLAADYFYPRNYWVNPGPIILGVFVKFLIASHGQDHASHHHAADRRPRWGRWLDNGVTASIILAGIWAAIHH